MLRNMNVGRLVFVGLMLMPIAVNASTLECKFKKVYVCDVNACLENQDLGGITFDTKQHSYRLALGEAIYSGPFGSRVPGAGQAPAYLTLNGRSLSNINGRIDSIHFGVIVGHSAVTMILGSGQNSTIYLCQSI